MKKIAIVALLLALALTRVETQSMMTIQPSTTSAITNTTTTRNVLQVGASGYTHAAFLVNITGGGAVTGTLNLFIQDSLDGGSTWNDLIAANTFTFGASPVTQRFTLYGDSDGPGVVRSIAGSAPAAGAEISETVPAGVRWQLLGMKYQLVASATVANRQSTLLVDDGTTTLFYAGGDPSQPASSTFLYSYGQGYGGVLSGGATNAIGRSFPSPNFLIPGFRLRTQTASIQVGDQYSSIQYVVREWRDLPATAQVTESYPAGMVRTGPWGDRLRVREKVSGVGGSPTGVTYSITAVFR